MGMIMQNGKLFSGEPKTTYTERVLWSGPATPSLSGTVITLTDAISNYDEIVFKIGKYAGTYAYGGESAFTVSLLTIGDLYIDTVYTGSYQGAYWDYLSDTSINIKSTSTTVTQTYEKIIGIKYGDTVKRKDYHKYSTEERIIGEWIDGKPLYEKTINLSGTFNFNNNEWTNIVNLTDYNVDRVISCDLLFSSGSEQGVNDGRLRFSYLTTTKYLRGAASSGITASNPTIFIRYTKSTT